MPKVVIKNITIDENASKEEIAKLIIDSIEEAKKKDSKDSVDDLIEELKEITAENLRKFGNLIRTQEALFNSILKKK